MCMYVQALGDIAAQCMCTVSQQLGTLSVRQSFMGLECKVVWSSTKNDRSREDCEVSLSESAKTQVCASQNFDEKELTQTAISSKGHHALTDCFG